MGHLGLTPQSIYKFGTYTVRAKEDEEADNGWRTQIIKKLVCCLVLEKYLHTSIEVAKTFRPLLELAPVVSTDKFCDP
jgi:ketopantoate hydroxymethyltransferase